MSGLVVQQGGRRAGEEELLALVVGSETFLAALPLPLPVSAVVAMQNLHHKGTMHGHMISPRIRLEFPSASRCYRGEVLMTL